MSAQRENFSSLLHRNYRIFRLQTPKWQRCIFSALIPAQIDWAPRPPVSQHISVEPTAPSMDHLDQLEAQSIYIFREAFGRLKKIALLWSLGKDSTS